MTDGVDVKTFGITHVIPSDASNTDKVLKGLLTGLNSYMQGYVSGVLLNEIVKVSDPWVNQDELLRALLQETSNLKQRRGFEEVVKSDLLASAAVLTNRFVLTLKHIGTENERAKARLVDQRPEL